MWMAKMGWFPCAKKVDGESTIIGALHDFSKFTDEEFNQRVARIDRYEGVPYLYTREIVNVIMPDTTVVEAYMYVFNPDRFEEDNRDYIKIDSGDWLKRKLL